MDLQARIILRHILHTHGRALTGSPELLEGMLLAALSPFPRELNVLVAALHEDIPAALALIAPQIPETAIQRLAKQLEDCQLLKSEAATWAVETWAEALRDAPLSLTAPDSPAIVPHTAHRTPQLKSRMAIEVYTRPEAHPTEPFKRWGSTPGTVPLPEGNLYLFKKMALNDAGLEKLAIDLAQVDSIYGLDLSSGRYSAGALIAFLERPFLQGLRSLYLGGTSSTTDAVLECIARRFPTLEELTPGTRCYVTDAGLQNLAALASLRKLSLAYCAKITAAGLEHLRGLAALETLDLNHTGALGDDALAHLQQFPRLRALDLSNCHRISDAGLDLLGSFPSIGSLKLDWNPQISADGLAGLRPLDGLIRLSLVKCTGIRSEGLAHLAHLHSLEDLDLAWMTQVSDDGLEALAQLRALRRLSLYHCDRIGDAGLLALCAPYALQGLRVLDLAGVEQISDRGLEALGRLGALEELTLDGRNLTGDGLQGLIAALPNLHRLHVWSAGQISADQAARFRRPGMDVWIRGTH